MTDMNPEVEAYKARWEETSWLLARANDRLALFESLQQRGRDHDEVICLFFMPDGVRVMVPMSRNLWDEATGPIAEELIRLAKDGHREELSKK